MDGNKHPGWQYGTWEGYLQAQLPVESELVMDLEGGYDSGARMGWLGISIYNEGAETLSGDLQCVLTESGLYYHAHNGLDWHHHVMRDMIPTETGTPVTIAPGETEYIAHQFFLDSSWDETECEFVCFVQHDYLQPDSTKEVWQGAKIALTELVGGAADVSEDPAASPFALHPCSPNPGRPGTEIVFDLPRECEVSLAVYDVTGRRVITLHEGVRAAGRHAVTWRGSGENGEPVPSGMYFYRLDAGAFSRTRQVLIAR